MTDDTRPKKAFNLRAEEERAFTQALFTGDVAEATHVLTSLKALGYCDAVRLIRDADLSSLNEENTAALLAIAAGREVERVVAALDAAGPVPSTPSKPAPSGYRLH